VGIAEQHAVTFSAGLAIEGLLPYCVIYSSFMQRAYDQIIHDVAIQNLSVVFCLDRGGLVGNDGSTHHGAFDLTYMRSIPNMIVSAPMNEEEMRNLMYTAQLRNHGPFSIRYPKGSGVMPHWRKSFKEIPVGKGRIVKEGTDLAILSIGHIGNLAVEACNILKEEYSVAHYDMRFVKPLDQELLHKVFSAFSHVITVEDGTIVGGFGSAVLEFMSGNHYRAQVHRLGIPDRFIDQGTQEELYHECGFDVDGICRTVREMVRPRLLTKVI